MTDERCSAVVRRDHLVGGCSGCPAAKFAGAFDEPVCGLSGERMCDLGIADDDVGTFPMVAPERCPLRGVVHTIRLRGSDEHRVGDQWERVKGGQRVTFTVGAVRVSPTGILRIKSNAKSSGIGRTPAALRRDGWRKIGCDA